MSKERLVVNVTTPPSGFKRLYAFLLNVLIVLAICIVSIFALARPILSHNESFQNEITLRNEAKDTIYKELTDSGLYVVEFNISYTFEMMFKLYLADHIILAHDYYGTMLDEYGYKTSYFTENRKKASYVADENSNEDLFYHFYHTYLKDKNLLSTPIDENNFYEEVLMKVENSYWVKEDTGIPHLSEDASKYLFRKAFYGESNSYVNNYYNDFQKYIYQLYENCGSYLMQVEDYKNALDQYNHSESIVQNRYIIVALSCYLFGLIITFIVIPLCLKNRQTLGYKAQGIIKLSNKAEKSFYVPILDFIFNFIMMFFLFGFTLVMLSGSASIIFINLGSIKISLYMGVSIVFGLISIICSMVLENKKTLTNIIGFSEDFTII